MHEENIASDELQDCQFLYVVSGDVVKAELAEDIRDLEMAVQNGINSDDEARYGAETKEQVENLSIDSDENHVALGVLAPESPISDLNGTVHAL